MGTSSQLVPGLLILYNEFDNYDLEITATFPRGQWAKGGPAEAYIRQWNGLSSVQVKSVLCKQANYHMGHRLIILRGHLSNCWCKLHSNKLFNLGKCIGNLLWHSFKLPQGQQFSTFSNLSGRYNLQFTPPSLLHLCQHNNNQNIHAIVNTGRSELKATWITSFKRFDIPVACINMYLLLRVYL